MNTQHPTISTASTIGNTCNRVPRSTPCSSATRVSIGDYVTISSTPCPFIAIAITGKIVTVLDPINNIRLEVLLSTITSLGLSADLITKDGHKFLVTAKNLIISLTSQKVMRWSEFNGHRVSVLAIRDTQTELRAEELSLANDVAAYNATLEA